VGSPPIIVLVPEVLKLLRSTTYYYHYYHYHYNYYPISPPELTGQDDEMLGRPS